MVNRPSLRFPLNLGAALILLSALCGCDRRTKNETTSTNNSATLPTSGVVAHAGVITGQVFFSGADPNLPPLDISSVPDCARHHPNGLPDETVVINPNGTLKNVVVYLKDGPRSGGATQPAPMLDQVDCQYVPHVIAAQVGRPLLIKSSDPFLHNVHIAESEPAINWAFIGSQQRQVIFQKSGCFTVRCDVHPWMKAMICVLDTGCFAVSDDRGHFAISNIPPGHYTLVAHHERFGDLSRSVEVPPDGSVNTEFKYQ